MGYAACAQKMEEQKIGGKKIASKLKIEKQSFLQTQRRFAFGRQGLRV
jgi:hypothetical protein